MAKALYVKDVDKGLELIRWAGSLIPHIGVDGGFDRPFSLFEVVSDEGKRLSAIIFHDFQPEAGTMQVSAASSSPYWANPDVLHTLLSYAFDTNKVRKLWMAIPASSEEVLKFNTHLGFRWEAILRKHFSPTEDAIILSMMEDEYRATRWSKPYAKKAH